jgi:hypothetical protein
MIGRAMAVVDVIEHDVVGVTGPVVLLDCMTKLITLFDTLGVLVLVLTVPLGSTTVVVAEVALPRANRKSVGALVPEVISLLADIAGMRSLRVVIGIVCAPSAFVYLAGVIVIDTTIFSVVFLDPPWVSLVCLAHSQNSLSGNPFRFPNYLTWSPPS